MFLAAAVVLVQIVPAALADQYGEHLITACTQGLREGACVLAGESTVREPSTVVAEVHWEDEAFRVAVIRLGRPNLGEREWTHGKVIFDQDDELPDRWTTAGFTIATLAGDLVNRAQQAALPREQEAPVVSSTPPEQRERDVQRPPRASAKPRLRTSAGYALGQAMHEQPSRMGAWVSVAYSPLELPVGARLRGAASWVENDGTAVRWTAVGLGLETRLPADPSHLGLVVAADLGPSVVSASSDRKVHRVTAAAAMFVGVDVPVAGPLSIVAGAEVNAGPATELRVREGTIADRRFKLGGMIGLGLNL